MIRMHLRRTSGGLVISANGKFLRGNRRMQSQKQDQRRDGSRLSENSVNHRLIEDPTGKTSRIFEVTHSGFQLADNL